MAEGKRLVLLMIEQEQPEGLSARKLVVETAKHNVLTAYSEGEGIALLERLPNVDAVLVHGMIRQYESIVSRIRSLQPRLPIIVAAPVENQHYPEADYVVPSHEPAKLLELLAGKFHASLTN